MNTTSSAEEVVSREEEAIEVVLEEVVEVADELLILLRNDRYNQSAMISKVGIVSHEIRCI